MSSDALQPTLAAIAAKAGVSISTASRVLRGVMAERFDPQTSERVRRIARELGYTTPRAGSRRRGGAMVKRIALLYSSHLQHLRPNPSLSVTEQESNDILRGLDSYSTIIMGIQQGLIAAGYQWEWAEALDTPEKQIGYLNSAFPGKIAGLLACGDLMPQTIEFVNRHKVPLVYIGDRLSLRGKVAGVADDGFLAGQLATEHLLAQGHRRIAYLGDYLNPHQPYHAGRIGGYSAALLRAHIPVDSDLLLCPVIHNGQCLVDDVVDKVLALEEPPTAIVGAASVEAIQLCNALRQRGIGVPQTVSVVSLGNPLVADVIDPPLTCVDMSMVAMGRAAIRLLLERIANPLLPPEQTIVPVSLVSRESVAALEEPTADARHSMQDEPDAAALPPSESS